MARVDPHGPRPGTYREFGKDHILVPEFGGASGLFYRDRTALRVPQALFRCFAVVVENNSAAGVVVALPGGFSKTIRAGTTGVLEIGAEYIDAYTLDSASIIASGDVELVEKCLAWNGYEQGQGNRIGIARTT